MENVTNAETQPVFFTVDDGSNPMSVAILTQMLAVLHNPQRRKFRVMICKSFDQASLLAEIEYGIAVFDNAASSGRFSPVLTSTFPPDFKKPAWLGSARRAILIRFRSEIRAIVAESARQIPAVPARQYGTYKQPLSHRPRRHTFFKADAFSGEPLEYVA